MDETRSMKAKALQPVFRFAPSPNGYLHLGHAYSALLNEATARRHGGKLLLRLEDIDTQRCRPEFAAAIVEDLDWLGIEFEGEALRQSQRFAAYRSALERLQRLGVLFPCFCSRAQLSRDVAARESGDAPWPRDPDGAPLYPGACKALPPDERQRRMAAGEEHSWRLDHRLAAKQCPDPLAWREFDPQTLEIRRSCPVDLAAWGDVILARKDIGSSYHLSVVVDDAWQGVTHIVRGQDLFAASAIHRVLQHLLDLPPPLYHHHPLINDEAGMKLSKSLRSRSLRSLREEGIGAAEIRRMLGFNR